MVSEWRHLRILPDCGQARWFVSNGNGLCVGVRGRSHGRPSVDGGWRSEIRDGCAIGLFHRLEFGTGTSVPLVCGTAIGPEAMAPARGEGVASGLHRVQVIVVGIDRL